jgi:hypothetical protein
MVDGFCDGCWLLVRLFYWFQVVVCVLLLTHLTGVDDVSFLPASQITKCGPKKANTETLFGDFVRRCVDIT